MPPPVKKRQVKTVYKSGANRTPNILIEGNSRSTFNIFFGVHNFILLITSICASQKNIFHNYAYLLVLCDINLFLINVNKKMPLIVKDERHPTKTKTMKAFTRTKPLACLHSTINMATRSKRTVCHFYKEPSTLYIGNMVLCF